MNIDRVIMRLVEQSENAQLAEFVETIIEQRQSLEIVLNSLNIGIAVLDTQCKVLFVNKELRRLMPFKEKNYRDRLVWELFDHPKVVAFLKKKLPQKLTFPNSTFHIDNDGRERLIQLAVVSLVDSGRQRGCILLFNDVSEEFRRELEHRHREKLASLTTAAAGMAHDIRNPLSAISIHLQLLEKSVKRLSSSTVNEFCTEFSTTLSVISEEINQLNDSVENFLSLTRPEYVTLLEANLNAILLRVLNIVEPELRSQRIQLYQKFSEPLPSILADEQELQHALLNILKNAIQAMPQGGRLSVCSFYDSESVYLNVSDTGEGVAKELLEKIFEPYFTTKLTGSGLGLTRVYSIVKQHNGHINISANTPHGCLVKLNFPRFQTSQILLSAATSS